VWVAEVGSEGRCMRWLNDKSFVQDVNDQCCTRVEKSRRITRSREFFFFLRITRHFAMALDHTRSRLDHSCASLQMTVESRERGRELPEPP
jgi:hypothetical protein